jgi:hypothetical protein
MALTPHGMEIPVIWVSRACRAPGRLVAAPVSRITRAYYPQL